MHPQGPGGTPTSPRRASPWWSPKNAKRAHDARQQQAGTLALEALHRQVLPFLLRRVKEDVLGDLPPKIIQDYYCYLSPLQVRLYEDFSKTQVKQGNASSIATMASEEVAAAKATAESKGKTTHIFQALQYLRKLCSHPALVLNDQHPEYEAIKKEYGLESLRSLESAPKLQSLKYASFFLCPPLLYCVLLSHSFFSSFFSTGNS